jgi:sRNA-binding carbon storage regulator CsrA
MLKITVLGIQGSNVRLGFEVDDDIPVHRLEVWERINGNGRPAGLAEGAAAALRPLADRVRPQVRRRA